MRFKLGDITIRYIYDTHHLNIICIISYFNIFTFFKEWLALQYICYSFNKTAPYRWTLTLYILCCSQCIFCPQDRLKCDYSRLSIDFIAYSANNTGKRCVFVMYIHKGKCTTLIFIILWFGLSHQYYIQDNTWWLFFIVLHIVKRFVWDSTPTTQTIYASQASHLLISWQWDIYEVSRTRKYILKKNQTSAKIKTEMSTFVFPNHVIFLRLSTGWSTG